MEDKVFTQHFNIFSINKKISDIIMRAHFEAAEKNENKFNSIRYGFILTIHRSQYDQEINNINKKYYDVYVSF